MDIGTDVGGGEGTTDSYLSIHPSICKSRKDSRRQEMLEAYVRRVMLEGKRIDEVWHELPVTSYTKIGYGPIYLPTYLQIQNH